MLEFGIINFGFPYKIHSKYLDMHRDKFSKKCIFRKTEEEDIKKLHIT